MAEYLIQSETITPLFDQIRRITETEDAMTFESATASLLNIVPGGDLPNVEESVFGDNDASVEFGITSCGTIYNDNSPDYVGIEFKAIEAVSILGVRIRMPVNGNESVYLWNESGELVKEISGIEAIKNTWVQAYFTNPVNIGIGETFVVSTSGGYYYYAKVSEATFNSKLSFQNGRKGSKLGVCPSETSTTYIYGLIDVIIGEVSAELPEEYQIARATMDDIANEVKRITGTTGKISTAQMLTTLQSIQLQDKSVTPTAEVQTITPDDGYYGLSSVMVGAIDSTITSLPDAEEDEF